MNYPDQAVKRRGTAITVTLLFHAFLILMFIFWKLVTPIPPFPELAGGGGVMIDLGFSDVGTGERTPTPPKTQVVPPAPIEDDEALLTQEDPETEVSVTKPKQPTRPKPDKPVEKPREPTQAEKEQAALDRMNDLYNTKGSTGQGPGDGKGDVGRPDGTSGGSGTGTGGTGGGTGSGHGLGNDGMGYSLEGRSARYRPEIKDKPGIAGKVVIDIVVDAEGNVTNARQNLTLSTTMAHNLVKIATDAAYQWKFDKRTTGAIEQRGKITFIFRVE